MHRFKLSLTSCVFVTMLVTVFFTGTASAQTIHNGSAHQRAVAASCSYSERSNVPVWSDDGNTYLGYTIIWEGVCGTQVYAHEETISRVGSAVEIEAFIQIDYTFTNAFQQNENVSYINTGSIPFYSNLMGGQGCITVLSTNLSGCGDTAA